MQHSSKKDNKTQSQNDAAPILSKYYLNYETWQWEENYDSHQAKI